MRGLRKVLMIFLLPLAFNNFTIMCQDIFCFVLFLYLICLGFINFHESIDQCVHCVHFGRITAFISSNIASFLFFLFSVLFIFCSLSFLFSSILFSRPLNIHMLNFFHCIHTYTQYTHK